MPDLTSDPTPGPVGLAPQGGGDEAGPYAAPPGPQGQEMRTFTPDDPTSSPPRPQADFGAPIDVGSKTTDVAEARDDGRVPPLIAAADETATPHVQAPRPEPVLTRRISQGGPSYSEPDAPLADSAISGDRAADRSAP